MITILLILLLLAFLVWAGPAILANLFWLWVFLCALHDEMRRKR